jgi:hypothetical protein
MVDVDDANGDFEIALPPNARMSSVEFAADRMLRVSFEDGGPARNIAANSLAAIHGASILRTGMHPAPLETGSTLDVMLGKEGVSVVENLQFAVAVRSARPSELWYFIADTFNFRKSLGPDASMLLQHNLRLLLAKLTAAAPTAVQDSFVTAVLADLPLPPPLGSLMEFFKAASR